MDDLIHWAMAMPKLESKTEIEVCAPVLLLSSKRFSLLAWVAVILDTL